MGENAVGAIALVCDVDPNNPNPWRGCIWDVSDGVPDECQCIGDIAGTGDGFVNLSDLAQLLAHYGDGVSDPNDPPYANGDLDCDGDVDLSDFAKLLSKYGLACN